MQGTKLVKADTDVYDNILLSVLRSHDLMKLITKRIDGKKLKKMHIGYICRNKFRNLFAALTSSKSIEKFKFCEGDIDFAAEYGELDIIIWLHNNRTERCSSMATDLAAKNGHLEVIKWLRKNRGDSTSARAIEYAAENGHLNIVKWLYEKHQRYDEWAIERAATNGHFEVVKWLYENRKESNVLCAIDNAATNGHLEILKFLRGNTIWRARNNIFNKVLHNKHSHIIEYLLSHCDQTYFMESVCFAARNGNLQLLQIFHTHKSKLFLGAAFNYSEIFVILAECGHLESMKWLYNISKEVCHYNLTSLAAKNGHLEMVKWLRKNRTQDDIQTAIKYAQENNQTVVVEWLKLVSL